MIEYVSYEYFIFHNTITYLIPHKALTKDGYIDINDLNNWKVNPDEYLIK